MFISFLSLFCLFFYIFVSFCFFFSTIYFTFFLTVFLHFFSSFVLSPFVLFYVSRIQFSTILFAFPSIPLLYLSFPVHSFRLSFPSTSHARRTFNPLACHRQQITINAIPVPPYTCWLTFIVVCSSHSHAVTSRLSTHPEAHLSTPSPLTSASIPSSRLPATHYISASQ